MPSIADILTLDHFLILLGGLAGGFVSGLTGFGTGLTAMPFWLAATQPVIAAQLAAAGGALGQVQTIRTIWPAVRWHHVGHIVVAGLIGVPLGTLLLPLIPERAFKMGVGLFLVVYCAFMLIASGRWLLTVRRPFADMTSGFIGGVMTGLSGLSGPAVIVWASLHDWTRDEKRALFQVFNLTILLAMLIASALAGLMTGAFFTALAFAGPGIILGNQIGIMAFRRLDARGFDRIVLGILMLSGLVLVASNL